MVIIFSKVILEWDFYIVKLIVNIFQCEIFEKFLIKFRKRYVGMVLILFFKFGLDCIVSIQLYIGIFK